jgi:tRNA(Ile)-lysidine synthase
MKVENEFQSVINSINADYFYIACSGGIDSMVLLFLSKKLNLPIHVLHVNYNLRGNESLADAEFVKRYCNENNIPISIHEIHLNEHLKTEGGNLQNEARKVRYAFFKKKLNSVENSKLLIAHHLDDQIETFWLQLYRGSGLKGMAGMTKISGEFIRPLLNIQKNDLLNYAISNRISWRDDKSNSTVDYQRNLWRNEYIQKLNSEIPSINESVLILQQVFQTNLNDISNKIKQAKNYIIESNYIDLNTLLNFQITELVELFRSIHIPIHQLNPFIKLFNSQKGSKVKWENVTGIFDEIIREENGFSFSRIDQRFNFPLLIIESINLLPEKFDKNCYYFDPKKIKGSLKLRIWEKGDRIHPVGMKGSKLISDVITDAKIQNSNRRKQLVLCDEEKILACVGLCVDRRAIANVSTNIIRVSLKSDY